ncbi:CENP-S associating centromere protein X domain-containing protein [Trichoderma aethiopicum]
MPPKQSSSTGAARGRPAKASKAQPADRAASESSNPFESSDDDRAGEPKQKRPAEEEAAEPEKTIPRALLTRILHEFFTKDATRMSRDANAAVGKYVDIFVREAIARTAVEKRGGFLEVEDLEKVAPQLLLDL